MDKRIIITESEKSRIMEMYGLITEQGIYNFVEVEEKPIYPGCEKLKNEDERFMCFNQKIKTFLDDNIRHTKKTKSVSPQGKVWVNFVINSDGVIDKKKIALAKSSGDPDLDIEGMYVVLLLPKMLPARKNGQNVSMNYSLPINFKLDTPVMTDEEKSSRDEFLRKLEDEISTQSTKDKQNTDSDIDAEERRKREDEEIRKREEERRKREEERKRAEEERKRAEEERLRKEEEENKVFNSLVGKTVNLYNDSNQQVLYGRIQIQKLRFRPEDEQGGRSSIAIYDSDGYNYEIICLSNPSRLANYITEKGKYTDDFKYNKSFTENVRLKAGNFCKKPKADFGSIDKGDVSNLA